MSKQKLTTALWALLVIILGAGALAYNLGALDAYKLITAYVVAALLAVMGLAFLLALLFQRQQWYYVIPGFSFLSLGGIVYLSTLGTVRPEWLGALFLGGIALGFLVVFIENRRERWWALLQAETIVMIALMGMGLGIPEDATRLVGALLFGGFAASFFLVWLLSVERGRFVWALILSGVLAIFAANTFLAGQNSVLLFIWPSLLLLIGVFLLVRVFSSSSKKAPTKAIEAVETPPAPESEAYDEEPARIHLPESTDAPESASQPEVIEPEIVEDIPD